MNDSTDHNNKINHRLNRSRFLTEDEVKRKQDLWKEIDANESKGIYDAQPLMDLVYLGLIRNISNRNKVKSDLERLHEQLVTCAKMMTEIMEKSKDVK